MENSEYIRAVMESPLTVQRIFVTVAGDAAGGLLLSYIMEELSHAAAVKLTDKELRIGAALTPQEYKKAKIKVFNLPFIFARDLKNSEILITFDQKKFDDYLKNIAHEFMY